MLVLRGIVVAALVLAALGDLTTFLLILACDVELAFDVCLHNLRSVSMARKFTGMAFDSHPASYPQA